MATLINGICGHITGRLGGNNYSVRNGKTYVQPIRKRTTPPTEAMKARQVLFAKAATLSRMLLTEIKKTITFASNMQMQSKMLSAMLHSVASYSKEQKPKGMQTDVFKQCMNKKSDYTLEKWKYLVTVSYPSDGVIRVAIPAFIPMDIMRAPALTGTVTCRIVVAALQPADGNLTGTTTHAFTFDYTYKELPEQIIDLAIPPAEGSLIITMMALEFNRHYSGGHAEKSQDSCYMPMGIVHAVGV